MTDPPKDGRRVRIYFDGAEVWLLNILAYKRLVYPLRSQSCSERGLSSSGLMRDTLLQHTWELLKDVIF